MTPNQIKLLLQTTNLVQPKEGTVVLQDKMYLDLELIVRTILKLPNNHLTGNLDLRTDLLTEMGKIRDQVAIKLRAAFQNQLLL